ncbi:hypothetical protein PV05_09894 [Exophiala xenobiotica]|uniref:Uncharacterized protein n=1 Tax=Exophiala xenobiotica TaxID=348802 RepID=A0A0D2E901_9EURO|nr:uncharacterized protein PV05_09894 [Exophiala xenobiotica]KIW51145.1 hypothetical protein PV05_09894 [Exophiala xenobiotica]MBV33905.1 hypothetical protein [Rickettsiales bacterium]
MALGWAWADVAADDGDLEIEMTSMCPSQFDVMGTGHDFRQDNSPPTTQLHWYSDWFFGVYQSIDSCESLEEGINASSRPVYHGTDGGASDVTEVKTFCREYKGLHLDTRSGNDD